MPGRSASGGGRRSTGRLETQRAGHDIGRRVEVAGSQGRHADRRVAFAEARSDGKILKTYSGLYVTHLKLGNVADAERTFGQLVALALAENNLSIRFLFRVNSIEFVADSRLVEQYRLWVRQLAAQLTRARTCVDVQGHSSKSGPDEYNDKLSLDRANALRRQLQAESPALAPLLRASGRGSRENLVGSGSDDARDAIDRRVEFRIISCAQPR